MNSQIFKNKIILLTGHTGFKGSWLTLWLLSLGAKVVGISKDIPTNPSHFKLLCIKKEIKNYFFDIKNLFKLKNVIFKHKPDFIFHLAAQALVKKSYIDTVATWQTNTIGTVNLLESLRSFNKKCYVVLITSDKSYKNLELKRGYKEEDRLGGVDPYSASKASAELAIQSYIKSFYSHAKNKIFISVARAGNVIGGGDWSSDRLIPDCFKSWAKRKKVFIRNPKSTRPWQHVLEALYGYLVLASKLSENSKKYHGEVFNFGPRQNLNFSVQKVLKEIKHNFSAAKWKIVNSNKFYESKLLKLNSNKAKNLLKWKSILSFSETVKLVADWYVNFYLKKKKLNVHLISLNQIKYFQNKIKKK
jgi:CDP-glucose 4,6-dehydratase